MSIRGPFRDKSGSCTTGATAQDIAAADGGRRYFYFQNLSDTDMWLNFGVTAVADQPSIKMVASVLTPLVFDVAVPTGRVSMLCATTGKKFTCKVI
jgi:hypothetical protein